MRFGIRFGKLKEPIARIEEPDSIRGRRGRISEIAQRFAGGKAASGETVKMPRRPHKTGGLV